MRRIKVTFDLGGAWRLVTTIQVSKTFTITQAKREAGIAANKKLRDEHHDIAEMVMAFYTEVVDETK